MIKEHVVKFMLNFGIPEHEIVDTHRGWMQSTCPLAPFTHAGGVDTRPSFGISVNANGPSVYYCFGCSRETHMLGGLLHAIFVLSGDYPTEAGEIYATYEIFSGEEKFSEREDRWAREEENPVSPLPPQVIRKYPLIQMREDFETKRCREFLRGRGVSEFIQNMYQVRYCYSDSAVIFPLTDRHGNIFVLRARSRKQKSMWTISPEKAGFSDLRFPKIKEVGCWFGMELVDWKRPVLLVEGELDLLRLKSLGCSYSVIASAGSSVSETQVRALTARTIITGFDDDLAGYNATKIVWERIADKAVLLNANWGIAGKKDPGDLQTKEEMDKVCSNLESNLNRIEGR